MNLQLTPAQQLLQQSARSFLQQRCPIERVQALALDPRGFPADLWKEIAALGWPGLLVPPDLGGGSGPTELSPPHAISRNATTTTGTPRAHSLISLLPNTEFSGEARSFARGAMLTLSTLPERVTTTRRSLFRRLPR